jgi:hypothetical protein
LFAGKLPLADQDPNVIDAELLSALASSALVTS